MPDQPPPTPLIQGQLVRLRAQEPEDAERTFRWINDQEVARFLIVRYPESLEDRQERLRSAPKSAFYGLRLSIETRDSVHIGNIELRDIQPENRTAELAVMIGDKRYWGGGYGTDAVRALVRFAFAVMNLHRVHLATYEYNLRAQAAFRKAGFKEEGRLRRHLYAEGRYWDVVLMGCLREEFEADDAPASA